MKNNYPKKTNLSTAVLTFLVFCWLFNLFFGFFNFSFAQGDFGLGRVEGPPKKEVDEVIVNAANWIMGIVGVVLVAVLIYGGILYLTSAGNEERTKLAKNVITYAIIGVVIIFAAYLIANFVISAVGG